MSDTTTDNDDVIVLNGTRHVKQSRWARDRNVSERTVARHRQLGLAWLDWAGEIWIPEQEGDRYILERVRRRNPPRATRRRRQQSESRDTA
jgi:hypothetical protein